MYKFRKKAKISGYACKELVDDEGDLILASAFTKETIDEYLKNPIITKDFDVIVGHCTKLNIHPNKGLYCEAEVEEEVLDVAKNMVIGYATHGSKVHFNEEPPTRVIHELCKLKLSLTANPVGYVNAN